MKRIIFSVLFLAIMIYFVMQTELGHLVRTGHVKQVAEYIQSYGWVAYLIAILAVVIQTFFPIVPFVLLAGANVMAFGLWTGFLVNWVGAVAAALANFFLARYAAHDWAEKKIGHHSFLKNLNRHAETRGFLIILLARWVPILPSSVINTAAGISKIPIIWFVLATLIGKVPAVLFESFLGHYLIHWEHHKGKLIIIIIGLVLFVLGLRYLKKKKEPTLLS
ncbi:putative membrane protein YdjX (TVP38/TMEM64 family) [Aneurinibacillus soli]|uniref:TVP38/TMEM64 family membrane protein n=2 Tax=Aneurinibacillus soli TaxID=1500254 RepID=A0A0U5C9F5_9BACL|nr:TVP38/TMEM64 family protein [Aneurinibacillus soli]PYE59700.1 putative membrane protein YdjX (TVP38/TMEM64 family) [Aneurinibacillus soli]BAU29299.1 TVP38/TMEM64 family inner membrane protein YdjZ [Aneurinibacillus soli]